MTLNVLGSTLEEDLERFLKYNGSEFCDITLMLHGDSVPAHKSILAARCAYFEAMFRSFMPENSTVNVSSNQIIFINSFKHNNKKSNKNTCRNTVEKTPQRNIL